MSFTSKTLADYIESNEHSSSEGLYYFPLIYPANDLGTTVPTIRKALAPLDGWHSIYDADAQVIFVVEALVIPARRPATQKQLEGAMNILRQLPSTPLMEDFTRSVEQHAVNIIKCSAKEDGGTREWTTTFLDEIRNAFGIPSLSHSDGPRYVVGGGSPRGVEVGGGSVRGGDGFESEDIDERAAAWKAQATEAPVNSWAN